MTSRDHESDYRSLAAGVQFALEQWTKGLNVCAPGHVVSYDAGTRRATVRPALDILTQRMTSVGAPLIPDVPVVWPSTRQWAVVAPLAEGDPVLLLWSQRGLTGFKRAHARAMPDVDRLFSLSDAVAVPGFGPTRISPASAEGLAVQSVDGSVSLVLDPDGRIAMQHVDGETTYSLSLEADGELLHNGEPITSGGEFAPPTPANARAESPAAQFLYFRWDGVASPAIPLRTYHAVYRRAGDPPGPWLRFPRLEPSEVATSLTWTPAPRRLALELRVRAYNDDGPSPWSPTVSITTA